MKEVQRRESKSRAVIEKTPLAVMLKADGQAAKGGASSAAARSTPEPRESRIRKAAYARWENRGRAPGHALDDWLAAEADLPE